MSSRSRYNTRLSAFKFLICAFLLWSVSCTNPDCKNTLYDLEVNLSVDPASTSYTTGDTITLTINAPVEILNRFSNTIETIKLFDVDYELYFYRLDSVSDEDFKEDDSYDNIEIITKSPDVRTNFFPGSIYLTPKLEGDSVYTSTISFRFKHPGVFQMQFNGFTDEDFEFAGENIKDKIILVDGCPKARRDVFNKINEGANNNLDILCETREVVCSIVDLVKNREESFDRNGSYVYKVIE